MAYEGILFGLGNPLLDILTVVDKDFLSKYNLKENDAILAESNHMPIYEEILLQSPTFVPGGATENSINVAQWVYGTNKNITTFSGSIKDDKYGQKLNEECQKNGVRTIYYYHEGDEPTGVCACLINGKNRSLVTNLGAANHFSPSHLDQPDIWQYVEKAEVFYIGGFFLTVSPPSIMKIAHHVVEKQKTLIMNLSAPFLCLYFQKPMLDALPYVNILFGNETEAAAFAEAQRWDTTDLHDIAKRIANWPVAPELLNSNEDVIRQRIVVITQGSEPLLLACNGKVEEWPVSKIPDDSIVDTNGAGDAFVGGFLAQYVQKKPIEECLKCAIWAATTIIHQVGCSLPENCCYE